MSIAYIRFAARGSPPLQRSPLLEWLIARAPDSSLVVDWRAEAFGLLAPPGTPMPPIATMGLWGSSAATGAAPGIAMLGVATPGVFLAERAPGTNTSAGVWACVATPVHLSAGMTQVTFPDDGILQLVGTEASVLAADFNAVFEGAGVRLMPGPAGVLFCVFDQALDVATRDPECAVGEDVYGSQPSGCDAGRLRRLMSEMEMWLFNHAVNQLRVARELPSITGLWLWGGGARDVKIPALSVWAAGEDVFFSRFGTASELPRGPASGVVVLNDCPSSPTWQEVERRWLQPALAQLRAGHIAQIHLSAARRRFTITSGLNLRFWRRTRPWWEAFDMSGDEAI